MLLIKKLIRVILRFLKIRGQYKIKNPYKIFTVADGNVFFGYYDKTPFSKDNTKILAHLYKGKISNIKKPLKIEIGYFDAKSMKFNRLDFSNTWCWQMGARLMWHPTEPNTCIYNISNEKGYASRAMNVITGVVEHEYDFPIYDLSPCGNYAASLNFSRLHNARAGYGYVNFPDEFKDIKHPKDDGVWIYELSTKKYKLIVSLDKLREFNKDIILDFESMGYINHLHYSKNGNYLYFCHVIEGSSKTKQEIPMIYSVINNEITVLTNDPISHECWVDDDRIMLYSGIHNKYGYNIYDVKSGEKSDYFHDILLLDGHPTYLPNNSLLTDTYPDIFGYMKLLYFDGKNNNKLAEFHLDNKYFGEIRCDLHPRLSPERDKCMVDVLINNKRQMVLVEMNDS